MTNPWSLYQRRPAFVLGFHGTDRSVVNGTVSRAIKHLDKSEDTTEWLGHGVYFWENDPARALEWAHTGKTKGRIEAPDAVGALAREVAREWTPRALAAGIDLGFEGEDHLQARADRVLLREALSNLIDNALRYCPRGASVTLRVRATGEGQCVLEVEDNGPGVQATDLPHLFERFWRASELPGGCGLGLAIVAEIAQRHGGSVQAFATKPQGLVVRVVLPLG